MGNLRTVWKHDRRQADQIARRLIDGSRIKLGWRVLLLPNFLVHYSYYRKNLYLIRKNFLFTKRLAFDAVRNISQGENRATEVRMIEIKTKKLLDKQRKGFYTEKIRRKQMQEIELLINHYLALFNSNQIKYEEMISMTYKSKREFLAFLNRLQRVEKEVIEAAITSMKKGSKQERVSWFRSVEEAFKIARMEEVEKIYPP